ncbi:hypothetical protein ACLOJK_025202 [Asimina triloba]
MALHHYRSDLRRWAPSFLPSLLPSLTLLWTALFAVIYLWQTAAIGGGGLLALLPFRPRAPPRPCWLLRPVAFDLTDFGGVGDGVTLNTAAFERAVATIAKLARKGGGQLNVPAGVYLTAPFNLTSHMTLFLAEDAVILGAEDEKYWPLMPPLPSYGYGREHPGPRYGSLIHGQKLNDVVITGFNGTIDGQDSCENVVIEDCYISVGDDGIAIKSGWDQYGIAYGRPSSNILLRNLVIQSMVSAGVSIGSEMSGGVSNVTVENLIVWNSKRAVRIKTSPGRGGYVRDIYFRNLTFDNTRVGIIIKTDYNEHPDSGYDPKSLPIIEDIRFDGVRGTGVRVPVRIHGSEEIPVKKISFHDLLVGISYKKKHIFQCSHVHGRVVGRIFPAPCENLDLYNEQGQLIKQGISTNVSDMNDDDV